MPPAHSYRVGGALAHDCELRRARAPARSSRPARSRRTLTGLPISSATISRWRSSTRSVRVPFTDRIRSSGRMPGAVGGAALHDLDHLDAGGRRRSRRAPAAAPAAGRRRCRGRRAARGRPTSARAITRWVAALIGTARPRPTPATAVLMPDHPPAAVRERAARVARVERGVGLDHVVDDAAGAPRARRQRAAERRDDAGGDRAAEPVRVADRDDELADAQALGVAELGGGEAVALGAQQRRGPTAGRGRRPRSAPRGRRRRWRGRACPSGPTTCADVSRKPSGVSTTALPGAGGQLPAARAAHHAQAGDRRARAARRRR